MEKRVVYSLKELVAVANELYRSIVPGSLVTLTGLLGSGKTTLVQEMCALLGVQGPVVSPTYSYVTVYSYAGGTVYHFDLYRISGIEEFESLGFSHYLQDSSAIVFIEWPDRIISLLQRDAYRGRVLAVSCKYLLNDSLLRELSWEEPDSLLSLEKLFFEE